MLCRWLLCFYICNCGCKIGGWYKDDSGHVDNGINGENDAWVFDFSCACIKLCIICDIFEANLAFPSSTRSKWFLWYEDMSKEWFFLT